MEHSVLIIKFIALWLIDILNIFTNAFIIYALRRLGKLTNISFWFIYWLSISDCFVGLTGLSTDIYSFYCKLLKQESWQRKYVVEMRIFFLAYSMRLITIIAIDRSIRMKYLYKYNSMITKAKAYLVLLVNAVLGIVQFVGSVGQHHALFQLVFLIFHFVCTTFICMLYIFTYCTIKQQVYDLHSNLRHNGIEPTADTKVQPNAPFPSSQPKQAEGKLASGRSRGKTRYQNALRMVVAQERSNTRCHLVVISQANPKSTNLLNAIPERCIESNPSNTYCATKCLPGGKNSMDNCDHDHRAAVVQSTTNYAKAEAMRTDRRDKNLPARKDTDVGRAMLLVALALVFCYLPISVQGFIQYMKVRTIAFSELAMMLLLANSSCNAVILTIFSRDIRNFARTVLKTLRRKG